MSGWFRPALCVVAWGLLGGNAQADDPTPAGTIAVVVDAPEGPLPATTVRSVVWHALYERHGHRAVFLDALDSEAVDQMRGTPMTTLLHIELEWRPDSAKVEQPDDQIYVVGGHYPVIDTTEYAMDGNALAARFAWHTEGPISVFHVQGEAADQFISLPEISLQETATLAIDPLHAPVWTAEADPIKIPIVLAADDAYRSFYGENRWSLVASRALSRANALLEGAGLELEVVDTEAWHPPTEETDLSVLLKDLTERPIPHERALRVAFTVQPHIAVAWESEMEDVGRAYLPGRNVVVVDQAAYPGHDPAWDVAEEGVAVAHEVLHALGVPHTDDEDMLMSAVKRGSVHRLRPATVDLARAAANSRYTHWDGMTALASLSQSAESHIDDRALQIDYIADNLAYGAGLPRPGSVEPRQLSALTNVALGRYYLKQASEDPQNASQLREGARVHVELALAQAPAWQEARTLSKQIRAATRAAAPAPSPPTAVDIAESIHGIDVRWKRTHTCAPEVRGTCESR